MIGPGDMGLAPREASCCSWLGAIADSKAHPFMASTGNPLVIGFVFGGRNRVASQPCPIPVAA